MALLLAQHVLQALLQAKAPPLRQRARQILVLVFHPGVVNALILSLILELQLMPIALTLPATSVILLMQLIILVPTAVVFLVSPQAARAKITALTKASLLALLVVLLLVQWSSS
jgi:hypothetical protein